MLKFYIEYGKKIKQHPLQYLEEECSFYTGKPIYQTEMELILNKISLSVNNNFIVNVEGFCGYKEWIKADIVVPEFNEGVLKVEHDLKLGIAWGINDEDWPVYVNDKIGWVCIGDPDMDGEAVEFIDNCVAIIDSNNNFVTLWLRPEDIPKNLKVING